MIIPITEIDIVEKIDPSTLPDWWRERFGRKTVVASIASARWPLVRQVIAIRPDGVIRGYFESHDHAAIERRAICLAGRLANAVYVDARPLEAW